MSRLIIDVAGRLAMLVFGLATYPSVIAQSTDLKAVRYELGIDTCPSKLSIIVPSVFTPASGPSERGRRS